MNGTGRGSMVFPDRSVSAFLTAACAMCVLERFRSEIGSALRTIHNPLPLSALPLPANDVGRRDEWMVTK